MDLGKDSKDQQYYKRKAARDKAKIIKEMGPLKDLTEVAGDSLRQRREGRRNNKKDSENCLIS